MEEGLPRPELQREIFGPDGRLIARVDFYWDEHKTVGEFDGKIKYGRLLRPRQRVEDVIFDEKVREDAVRDLGLQVIRWIWQDLYRTGVLRGRVRRALRTRFLIATPLHSRRISCCSPRRSGAMPSGLPAARDGPGRPERKITPPRVRRPPAPSTMLSDGSPSPDLAGDSRQRGCTPHGDIDRMGF